MFNFSVIIPTCNRYELLKRAVRSVLNQRMVSPEIIVVDDSNDGDPFSANIEEYLRQSGIKYLQTGGGKGGGYSRNLGLSHACGELVAFLDDDDQWMPDKLHAQAQSMTNKEIGLCYTGVNICRPDGSLRYLFRKPSCSDHFKSIMKKNFIGTTSSVVAWRSHLESAGGFDVSLPALQDYDLYIRILKGRKAHWVPRPLTWYDDSHGMQKVSGNRQNYLDAMGYMLKKYEGEKHYSLLKRSLRAIEILKIYRSRQFLRETIAAIFRMRGTS